MGMGDNKLHACFNCAEFIQHDCPRDLQAMHGTIFTTTSIDVIDNNPYLRASDMHTPPPFFSCRLINGYIYILVEALAACRW